MPIADQPTLAELMRNRALMGQMPSGQLPNFPVMPGEIAPPAEEAPVPSIGAPTAPAAQPAQPRLRERVIGGMEGQPGGGTGGTVGRLLGTGIRAAGNVAMGPTQEPDIERERLQQQGLGGQALIEKMRLAEEDKRLQEMLAATGMRVGAQRDIAAGHDATREDVVGQQQAGAEQRTEENIAGRSGLQTQRDTAAGGRLQQQIAERQFEAKLKADTGMLMEQMRIEAAKQLRLMPPTQIRAMAYTAQSTMNEIPKGIAMVDQLGMSGKLGPLAGRWNDLVSGQAGFQDPQYMQLREFLTLNVAAALRTHFGARGGQLMFDKFLENLNIAGQSPANIKAAMAEVADWFGGYVDMATQPGYLTGTPAPLGPGGPPAPGQINPPQAPATGPWSKYGK